MSGLDDSKGMPSVAEYTPYDRDSDHLPENEALKLYSAMKASDPEAIVVLRDLDCGHWQVRRYSTQVEKNEYLNRYLRRIYGRFVKAFAHIER